MFFFLRIIIYDHKIIKYKQDWLQYTISLLNLSCPAVSHSCKRTVRSSKYIVLERKSMPMVAWTKRLLDFLVPKEKERRKNRERILELRYPTSLNKSTSLTEYFEKNNVQNKLLETKDENKIYVRKIYVIEAHISMP